MGTDSDLQDMLLDGEMRIDFLEGENCDLREENKRLQEKIKEMEKLCADRIIQATYAKEEGAMELAAICEEVCRVDVRKYISSERLMQLWREGKK